MADPALEQPQGARHYFALALFYHRPNARLLRAHTLDPQDQQSVARYAYREDPHPGETYTLKSHWEGPGALFGTGVHVNATHEANPGEHTLRRFACDDRSVISFAMPLQSPAAGAILRRTLDYKYAPQAARVTVNGRDAGLWHTADNNPHFRLRDDDFYLTPGLLGSELTVTVRLQLVCLEEHTDMVWTQGTYTLLRHET